jgi:3-methyladenine DNA glycosylase AlkD
LTSEHEAADPSEHARGRAEAIGARLADLVDEPEAFVEALEAGLAELSDPAHALTLRRMSPDVASPYAVRSPLLRAIERPVQSALREGSSSTALWLAGELERATSREVRMFARLCLLRALPEEPERSWQTMRRLASRAEDWIEVDALAHVWAVGILAEPFRWAELEQLVYSASAIERRLVGATLATMTHELAAPTRAPAIGDLAPRAIDLVGSLIGDGEPIVQKALGWALRSWHPIAPDAVEAFLRQQATIAVARSDGHRAWVVREVLPVVRPPLGLELRRRLVDVRRRTGSPSSSIAAEIAARYGVSTGEAVAAGQGDRYTRVRR